MYGPPPAKSELTNKKKPLSRQQIAIYVVSTLIILSMAIGFIVSGLGGGATAPQHGGGGDVNIEELLATPAPGDEPSSENSEGAASEDSNDPAAEDGMEPATGHATIYVHYFKKIILCSSRF